MTDEQRLTNTEDPVQATTPFFATNVTPLTFNTPEVGIANLIATDPIIATTGLDIASSSNEPDRFEFEGPGLASLHEKRITFGNDYLLSTGHRGRDYDYTYLNALKEVLTYGSATRDRTGVGTISQPGLLARYPVYSYTESGWGDTDDKLCINLPLLTTKKIAFKSVLGELIWFLNGDTNTKYLADNGIPIWNEWADKDGNLGPVYGSQWRDFNGSGYDQIKALIENLRANPQSRRHVVSAWNPLQLKDMALPPCHTLFQLHVLEEYRNSLTSSQDWGKMPEERLSLPYEGESGRSPKRKTYSVSLSLYQRSADMFLGVPFNIASYSLLLSLICKYASTETDLFYPKEFIHHIGDAHIYLNHIDQVKLQLSREPKMCDTTVEVSQNAITGSDFLKGLNIQDFVLKGYQCHDAIKAPIAV